MKRIILVILLLIWTALILFLSFQNGTDTANTSMKITEYILGLFMEGEIPYEMVARWHMTFRLWAHPVLFGLFSILAMGVTTEFSKKKWLCIIGSAVAGVTLSVATEFGKWNIPGRHVDYGEMWLNILGAVAGIILYIITEQLWHLLHKKR